MRERFGKKNKINGLLTSNNTISTLVVILENCTRNIYLICL